ncbi:MAG: hypothetical protein JWM88_2779 [Verrucomicrobia bacterium]|nr:hypothetical protein [Verrucomicrobiota bacterium]
MNSPTSLRLLRYCCTIFAFVVVGVASSLRGQTVLSGTYSGPITGDIAIAGSASAVFNGTADFSGTNATLGSYSSLTYNRTGTFSGKIFTMGSGGAYAQIVVGSGYSLTFGSGTSLTGNSYIYGNASSTLINQGAINQTSGTGYLYGPTVTNASGGTITASAGSTLYFGYNNGESLTNASGGSIAASGAGSTIYLHNVNNLGTLSAINGGLIQFTGSSTTTANLGSITLSGGGRAVLNGLLNNSSATLNAPTGGVFELSGGTIQGGTIAAGAVVFTSGGSQLDNVILQGNLVIPASATLNFSSNSTFTGTSATIGAYGTFVWTNTTPLSGKTITFGSGSAYGQIYVNNGITFNPTNTTSMTGDVYISGAASSTVLNQGAINHTFGTGYLYAPTFTNASGGTITAGAGTTLYLGYSSGEVLTNANGGTVTSDGATLYLHGIVNQGVIAALNGGILQFTGTSTTTANLGTVTLASGARALLNNSIDNSSATLVAPTGGVYELYGGTISNGTIGAGALTFTNYAGTLSSVSFTGNLVLPASTAVTFTNGTTFTGTAATLGNYSTLNWNQNGTLAGKTMTMGSGGGYGQIYVGSANSLTLDSATSLTGNTYLYGAGGSVITNQGTITQNAGTGYFYGPTVTNASGGVINIGSGGSFYFGYYGGEATTNASGGTITANGTGAIAYLHSLVNQGTLNATNGGVLQFSGASTTTANLGTVVLASGGRALLNNTIDNSLATLAAPTGGQYELYGGTISNGTIGAGALTFTNYAGTLSNVSFTGNLALPASTSVTFTNGATFTGTAATLGNYSTLTWNQNGTLAGKAMTMGAGGGYGQIYVGNGNSLTFDSATSLTGNTYLYGAASSAITNQGTITQNAGTGYFYGPSVTNASGGVINVDLGSSFYFGYYGGETTTNAAGGTFSVDGSGSIAYLHGLVNQGTLNATNGGVLQFTGASTTTANLGTVVLASGGRALLNNTIDNSLATLVAPTGGQYELYGGTISNGTIGAGALTFTNYAGTLSNVSYTGNFTLPASGSVTFTNGTSFTGGLATFGNYSTLNWNQNGTLTGKALTLGSGGGYGQIYVGNGNSLTFDSATSLIGNTYLYGAAGSAITNQGTITQNAGTGYFYGPSVTNAAGGNINVGAGATLYFGYYTGEATTNASGATISVNGAGATAYLHDIFNQGTLSAQNGGSLVFTGSDLTSALGSVTLSGGGRALLNGIFDNTAATLNGIIGGSFELYGGTINNGAVAAGALGFTTSGGILNGVTLNGDVTFGSSSSYARFTGGTNFTGTTATLASYSGIYWEQVGALSGKTVNLGNGAYIYLTTANSALTLDATSTLTGSANIYSDGSTGTVLNNQGPINQTVGSGNLYARSFVNSGTININTGSLNLGTSSSGYSFSNTSASTIAVNGGNAFLNSPLTNAGTLNIQSGTFYSNGNLTNGSTGVVRGGGTLNGSLVMAGGALAPGNGVGTLTLTSSSFSVTAASILNIEINGASSDKLLFQSPTANVDIGSGLLSLSISLLGVPTNGTTYTIVSIPSGTQTITGTFAGLPLTNSSLTATFGSQDYQFFVNYLPQGITLNFTPVPEPSTCALLAAGLSLLGLKKLRRRPGVASPK